MKRLIETIFKEGILMKKLSSFLLFVFFLLLFTRPAYAYLNPGIGSMLLQGLIAVVLVISVTIGMFWSRIKAFFGRFIDRRDNNGDSHNS